MLIRSFLAFDIPDPVKKNLAKIIFDFSNSEKRVKWTKAENLHVTLKFFGDVEESLLMNEIVPRIEGVSKGLGNARLMCMGIGVFPNWRYPRIIWAGFSGDTEKVVDLQKTIEGSLSLYDLKEERKGFRLHLTLGRAKGVLKNSPAAVLAERLGPVKFGAVDVSQLVLYKSVLTKNGPIYTPLKTFDLV